MILAALLTIARKLEQAKCPSADKWIMRIGHVYTMEFYSFVRKNKIMKLSGQWLEPEMMTVREITKTQKDKWHVLSLSCVS